MNNNAIDLEFKLLGDCYTVGLRGKNVILTTNIPAFDPDRYHHYRQAYWKLFKRNSRINGRSTNVITLEDLATIRQNLDNSATNLLHAFNHWGESPQFAKIAKAICDRSENLRVTISTECEELRKLPFHKWSLFPDGTEVTFSGVEAKEPDRTRHPDKIRILVILGDTTGINIEEDEKMIKQYCGKDAELVFLAQPDRSKLTATLADANGWDIIFFSGHSEAGQISINPAEDLTMAELKDVLAPAIAKRVQIFIFNSCDGLKLAPDLEKLSIDRLIVMRELIPDPIAPEFLKSFLKAFTGGEQFDDAVKSARQQLVKLEDTYPYVSWLPIVIQNRLVASPTWQSLGKIRSPYKGLAAFTEADRDYFYGRDEIVAKLLHEVYKHPLVPIIGASGSGKSSIVQAGLIPALRGCEDVWQIFELRPGQKPFDALARALLKDRSNQLNIDLQQQRLDEIELDVYLQGDRSPETDRLPLTDLLVKTYHPDQRILIFIDQFEELFTQTEDETTRKKFLNSLVELVQKLSNFTLVFTIRNDFLSTIQDNHQHSDLGRLLERYSLQPVSAMSPEMLKIAIEQPAKRVGVEFERDLIDRLVQDMGNTNQNGGLPLLQFILDRLWQEQEPRLITYQSYERICGKEGFRLALANHAEKVYARFLLHKKEYQFKQVLLCLVRPTETTVVRRVATLHEIGEVNWRQTVAILAIARLVITDRDKDGVETVELIHEAIILYWQRLQNWVEEYKSDLIQYRKIELAAKTWLNSGKSKLELWSGKKLKDAKKFQNRKDLFRNLSKGSNAFINASSEKQLFDRSLSILLQSLMISPWILIGYILFLSLMQPKIDLYPTEQPRINFPIDSSQIHISQNFT
jgi:AAA ATPase domain